MLPLSSNKKSDSFHRHAILNALDCITNKNEVFWSRTFISFGHCHVLREANRYSYKKISKLKAIIIGPKHSWHNTLKTYEVLSRTKFSAHINFFLNKSLPLQRKIYIHTTLRSNWSPSKNISHEPHSRTAVSRGSIWCLRFFKTWRTYVLSRGQNESIVMFAYSRANYTS